MGDSANRARHYSHCAPGSENLLPDLSLSFMYLLSRGGFQGALQAPGPFSIGVLGLEREAESFEKRSAFIVVGRGGHHGDVHSANVVNLVDVDLVEH